MRTLLILFCALSMTACSCQRTANLAENPLSTAASVPSPTPASNDHDEAAIAGTTQQTLARRYQAMSGAVDVVHGYLGELGSGKQSQADQRWAYRRTPTDQEEAGIRSLPPLQSLKIRNDPPEPLDREAVPDSLRIPVTLVAKLDGGEALQFRGWYRLRRNPVETRWEITGASLSPVLK